MHTSAMVNACREGHMGTATLYLVVLCGDVGRVHNLLGDLVSNI